MRVEVTEQVRIARVAWEVRDQFRDITYHAGNPLHPRQRVAVLERREARVRYAMAVRVGPRTLHHEVVMCESVHGALLHEITTGRFAGSVFAYEFDWQGPSDTVVVATASVELGAPARPFVPLVRRWLRRALIAALDDDRMDLESGRYARAGRRYAHPSLA
jgi:hypothetical protein